ncbi:Calcium transporter [Rasamsonia emersonii CBS 393.64]|uniref:Calcium transporter n=1 Tax=Rasamsonia emersonii (strain ATCC 16479 / CBS 393.64 / IMI 116815) TaxID=1408163 RepID=A0A0F4YZF5_RASE3|nr:Calcium transporter [Rasamsonia emersonii CBS 393.64]KKA23206.1 Calcium transporter [Rasamsonia emersonii CBS 393.64]
MALLFLKNKLFPSSQNKALPAADLKKRSSRSSSPDQRRPLLADVRLDEETGLDGTVDSRSDLEAQISPSYQTFGSDLDETPSSNGPRSKINPRIISDAILGLSDGLTVPFALSAGLSALGDTKVVVLGGLAELTAGAISMGLGGESYQATEREVEAILDHPVETNAIVRDTFAEYGISDNAIAEISASLHDNPDRLRKFLITFHHKESEPDRGQAYTSAITLALGYFIGGFIPLIPYFCVSQVLVAFYYSIGVMAVTLLLFGYVKTCIVRGWSGKSNIIAGIKGGIQMCVVGGVAAGAAIALVRAIDSGKN